MCAAIPALQPNVSILIVNWNTKDLLEECLRSVYTHCDSALIQVIVVDNASSDGSADMVASTFPSVDLIRNDENAGFVKANNQAVAFATGRYLLLLNSDTKVLDDGLSELVAYMERSPDVGIVSGKVLNPDGSFQRPFRRFPKITGSYFRHSLRLVAGFNTPFHKCYLMSSVGSEQEQEVDWLSGAYLLVRRAVVNDGRVFDEDIYMYYEDTLLCYSCRKKGYRIVYLPMAPIIHYQGSSARSVRSRSAFYSFRGSVVFFQKTRGEKASRRYESLVLTTWWLLARSFRLACLLPVQRLRDKSLFFDDLVRRGKRGARTSA